MSEQSSYLKLDEPARYQIRIQGRLDENWVHYFEGMTLSTEPESPVTLLEGMVRDQADLFGLLLRLRDLGLPLLLVRWIKEGEK